MDKLICGGFEWQRDPTATDNRLDDGSLFLANAIVQSELSIDTLDANIFSLCKVPIELDPADYDGMETSDGRVIYCRPDGPDITDIPYGTPVEYYRNDVLAARLYKSDIVRDGVSVYRLSAVSAIGLLDKLPHMGGLYTGQPVSAVLADIIGGAFSYTVSGEVANILIFGWLPAASRRDNLRQLLFATGIAVRKTAGGGINFAFLSSLTPTEIDVDRIYTGGSTAYNTPASGVDVTEHAYYTTAADTLSTLFDNTDGSGAVDHKTITFDRPCHNLTHSSGLIVHESGVNYAIVSGTGTLTGKEYTHQTKIISRRLTATTSENIVFVKEATLVTMVNSGSVAERVLAYYSGAKTLTAGIVAGTERPGDAVILEDAFGDLTAGIVESMDIRISSTLKADATIVTGYIPAYHGSDYNNSVILNGSGTWTVPEGVTKIKVTLISGGNGGGGGTSGTAGSKGTFTRYDPRDAWYTGGTSPGNGGNRGDKGLGGKILTFEMPVTPGQQISYSCGIGGNGGGIGATGSSGTDTTFGGVSSASGTRNTFGFYDYYSGVAYATDGADGYDGADGATGVNTDPYPANPDHEIYPYDGLHGGNCSDGTRGGYGGTRYRFQSGTENQYNVGAACGGSGGGATHNVTGGSGANGTFAQIGETSNGFPIYRVTGGGGGHGANALPGSSGEHYGCGGNGGDGGGGGGCSGGAFGAVDSEGTEMSVEQGNAGLGGNGSAGGAGANGCAVVYY